MAVAAFALYVLFAVLAFGWRAWVQFKQTGDCGFRGLSGPLLSVAGLASLLIVAGGVAGFLAPLTAHLAEIHGVAAALPSSVRALGLVLMTIGAVVTLVAQIEMGASWRVGVDPGERTELVTTGLFAWVRNPIYTAMLTALFGLVLAMPNALAALAFVVCLVGLELHVRRVEEPHLLRQHSERFRAYARDVGRFVPGVGRVE